MSLQKDQARNASEVCFQSRGNVYTLKETYTHELAMCGASTVLNEISNPDQQIIPCFCITMEVLQYLYMDHQDRHTQQYTPVLNEYSF